MAPNGPACERCGQDILVADTCTAASSHRYGREPDWEAYGLAPEPRCPQCNTQLGWHHHAGCCMARCERCDEQDMADRGCGCGGYADAV